MGKIVFLLTVALAVSASLPLFAATWHVSESVESSGDGASWETAFTTIQEGIDASSHGHTVVVAQGTYVENIHFHGKNITLRSTDPLDPAIVAATIIDGNQSGSVVTFEGTETEACTLSGFTIRNGYFADYDYRDGGGVLGNRTHATIMNNVITQNQARDGGGLYGCHGSVRANTISANTAYGDGGALCACNGEVVRNAIIGNSAKRGGGLAFCQGIIEGNTISTNKGSEAGGGLYRCDRTIRDNEITHCSGYFASALSQCDGFVFGNRIRENDSSNATLYDCDGRIDGNAIEGNRGMALNECDGTIQNNSICGNRGDKGGAGLFRCDGLIRLNTVAYNSAVGSGVGFYWCAGVITNCVIWGNRYWDHDVDQLFESSQPTYSCIQDWDEGGEGNTAEDPRFVDPDGPDDNPETYEDNDYRLSPDSPCIDAGYNSLYDLPRFDFDGNLRIAFGGKSLTVDMGAYEYNSKPFAISQISLDNNSLVITWHSQPGDLYSVWWTDNPGLYTWSQAPGSPVPSQGGTTSFTPTLPPSASVGIYRIQMR